MVKNFFRELIIVLLICLAIILLLGILLYEYVPMSKTIPTPISYTTSEEVKKELQEEQGVDEAKIIMTYKVDSNELNNYKRTQNYKPGKANPFSSFEVTGGGTGNSSVGGQGGNVNSGTGNTTTENPTTNNNTTGSASGGTFFPPKGTK